MEIIKDVLCRLLVLTDSSRNFYVPTSTNLRLLPFNASSVSDLCLTPLCVKEDLNLPVDLPENRDILLPLLNGSETCKTPSCVKAAADILSFIDETVDPCDDFYKFLR
ncbi:neprilysin-11-like [Stegodyphus dumicola]|uniref:neprilysin-11-like n=1 Tax=Stegodyphus dumicola TaxID=202533 RepID=UPI0015B07B43|nr:neprilysin-11-like [Stegodyphus dumicola]